MTNEKVSENYFTSYEDLDIHQLMLDDKPRLKAYKEAIFNFKHVFADKIVMDVGAGTGILSIFCAQAGAKCVYAVEASNLANLAVSIIKENNLQDLIVVKHKKVEELSLHEIGKIDIIVSEWMGFYLVHEGMLDSVISARDRFLHKDGLMFPSIAKLYITPCQLPSYNEFWNDVSGVSMKCFGEALRQSKLRAPEILSIPENCLLSEPKLIAWLDLKSITLNELNSLVGDQSVIVCSRVGKCEGFCIWFDVEFPDETVLSTAPTSEETHWKQTVIVLPNSTDVSVHQPVAFQLKLDRDIKNLRRYNISLELLDALEVEHEIPCNCHMTKCIVTKNYIENIIKV